MESTNDVKGAEDVIPQFALIEETNELLHREIPDFDFANPPIDPIWFSKVLAENLLAKGGVGLAANQIGIAHRAFVLKSNPMIVMFNPKIVHFEGESINEEGCLSYPGLFMKIKRATEIRVRFTKPNGETTTETFTGMTARIIQHEVDHLNGITFKKKASLYEKNKGDRKRRKLLDRTKKGII